MIYLTEEQAQQIEEALKLAIRTSYSEHNNIKFEAALSAIRAARAQEQAEREPVKLIYEDELPEDYPYDEMFSRSIIIEGVRMFPEVQTEHSVVNESLTAEDLQIPAFLRRAGSFGD